MRIHNFESPDYEENVRRAKCLPLGLLYGFCNVRSFIFRPFRASIDKYKLIGPQTTSEGTFNHGMFYHKTPDFLPLSVNLLLNSEMVRNTDLFPPKIYVQIEEEEKLR